MIQHPPIRPYLAQTTWQYAAHQSFGLAQRLLINLAESPRYRDREIGIHRLAAPPLSHIDNGPAKGKVIEIWFQDETRIGQKNKITCRWARRGTRPSAPQDQRTRSAYLFGAIRPRRGKAAALVMPWCDTHAMNQHLIEISRHVDKGAHAILIMDQAGWHMSNNLVVPDNITILPLPPRCPELNPASRHLLRNCLPANDQKSLAVYAPKLALKPRLQILRR